MLDHVSEHAGVSIVTTDPDGLITGFNLAAERLYGIPAREVLGQDVSILSPTHTHAAHSRITRLVVQEQRAQSLITEHCGHDGKLIPVQLILSPLLDEGGVVNGVCHVVVDLSEQVAAQRALQHERDLLEALLETTNDAYLMIDTAGRVVTANPPFETFFRIPRFQVLGKSIETLLAMIRVRHDLPAALSTLLATFSSNSYQNSGGEFEMAFPERRDIAWYSAPVNAINGMVIGRLFIFREVTREREIDRMKTEFVQLVSHELRTPLQSIRGFADMIIDGEAGPITAEVRDFMEIIRQNSERLTQLISDILDLTRIEAGKIELFWGEYEVSELVEAAVGPLRPVIEQREQSLQISYPPDLPNIRVDRERFTQIITYLVENASKFTDNGGRLRIRAHMLGADDTLPPGALQNISLPAFLFGIHDNGMGIPAEEQEHVFTQFYRATQATRRQIKGSGLGLTLARSFIELHGGRIWFNSEVGRGTSVYFTIPHRVGV